MDKQAVLREIVKLDFYRILSRLRSRHAKGSRKTYRKTQPRRYLTAQLNETLQLEAVTASPSLSEEDLRIGREIARGLEASFARLESVSDINSEMVDVLEVIEEILKGAHKFVSAINLASALESLPNTILGPSTKEHLPRAVGKLGTYYSAASELVYAARDKSWQLFEKIHLEPFCITVPPSIDHPHLQGTNQHNPNIPEKLTEAQQGKFRRRMIKIEGHRKIHAEIQLLFFYELHPNYPRPRIISSSKSACYLCNLFFHTHNKFSVPRTHGRLYDKWILPDWLGIPSERHTDLSKAATDLKKALDEEIRRALYEKGLQRFNPPNESIVLPRRTGISSNSSSSSSTTSISTIPSFASANTIRSRFRLNRASTSSSSSQAPLTPSLPSPSTRLLKKSSPIQLSPSNPASRPLSSQKPISLISLNHNDLPYTQPFTPNTPSLHLQLDTLSLTLDFIHVQSGILTIMIPKEDNAISKVMDVGDIPTNRELRLGRENEEEPIEFCLKNGKRIIWIGVSWG